MDHILTLIAADGGLDSHRASDIRAALADLGADTEAPVWLAHGRAADIPFSLLATDQAEAAARLLLTGLPVDVVAQAVRDRRKKLLLADMDSTMVVGETLDELADFAGLKEEIAQVTARAMNGEIDFADAFRERVGRLAGLAVDRLDACLARIQLMPGGRALVATMRADGAHTVLVSGGFRFFTYRIGAMCGFDRDVGNDIEIIDGRLSGQVIEPIMDRDGKRETLINAAADLRLPMSLSLAVGDGANDLDMLDAAGLGVAFHAKPVVAERARTRIDHNDLTALLFIQGYREDDFAG